MQIVSASEAEQRFDELLEAAQHESVHIRRADQDVAVLMSPEEYRRLTRGKWDELDRLMDRMAAEAKANGFTEDDLKEALAENPVLAD